MNNKAQEKWRQHGVMVRDTTDTLGGMFRIQLDHGAGIMSDPVAFTINREDADRIVQAVNCHDDLLEACKTVLERFPSWPVGTMKIKAQLQAAIEKASAQ